MNQADIWAGSPGAWQCFSYSGDPDLYCSPAFNPDQWKNNCREKSIVKRHQANLSSPK